MREWIAKRRSDWFADKFCVRCGSVEDLRLDHIDPSTKISHNIWSWSQGRRDVEIAKCQVLCYSHHVQKTADNKEYLYGEQKPNSVLTEIQVLEIRSRHAEGEGLTYLGNEFGVTKKTVYNIVNRKKWKHI